MQDLRWPSWFHKLAFIFLPRPTPPSPTHIYKIYLLIYDIYIYCIYDILFRLSAVLFIRLKIGRCV